MSSSCVVFMNHITPKAKLFQHLKIEIRLLSAAFILDQRKFVFIIKIDFLLNFKECNEEMKQTKNNFI